MTEGTGDGGRGLLQMYFLAHISNKHFGYDHHHHFCSYHYLPMFFQLKAKILKANEIYFYCCIVCVLSQSTAKVPPKSLAYSVVRLLISFESHGTFQSPHTKSRPFTKQRRAAATEVGKGGK